MALVDEVFVRILNRPSRPEEVTAVKGLFDEIGHDHEAIGRDLATAEAAWKLERERREAARRAKIGQARAALDAATVAHEPTRRGLVEARAERFAKAVAAVERYHADPAARLKRFAELAAKAPAWRVVVPAEAVSRAGSTLEPQPDGSLLVSGKAGDETTTLTFPIDRLALTGLRLEAIPDARLPNGGAGRAPDGNFVVTEFTLDVAPASQPKQVKRVPLHRPQADFSQDRLGIGMAIDGDVGGGNGWAVAPRLAEGHWAVFEVKDKLTVTEPMVATVRIEQRFNGGKHALGRFRLSLTDSPAPLALGVSARAADLVAVPRDALPPAIADELDALAVANDPERVKLAAELAAAAAPLPPDPKLVALAAELAAAEAPVADDPAIVRLRADHQMSGRQLADRRLTAIQDLAWALINSPAFFFNH